jgi:dolichol-phosphate mannosyltransferase
LIVPAFNEEDTIVELAAQAHGALSGLGLEDFELILVDDGSIDSTFKRMESVKAEIPYVIVERHVRNLGYGSAILTGLRRAKMDYIAFTDADLQFDLSDLSRLLELSPTHDLVVGYREPRSDAFHRILIAKAYNGLCNGLFRLPGIKDIDCSLKVLSRSSLDGIELSGGGFGFDLELVARCLREGASIAQIPVRHRERTRGGSKVTLREILRTLGELLRLARDLS